MPRTRRTYTPEFKAEAVKLVTEQGYSVAEAARSLGLNQNLIRNWKQTLEVQDEHAFPGRGKLSPVEEENRRLRAENKRLQAERDILKKRRRSSPRRRHDLPLHRPAQGPMACALALPNPGGLPRRLLRLAAMPSPRWAATTRYPPG